MAKERKKTRFVRIFFSSVFPNWIKTRSLSSFRRRIQIWKQKQQKFNRSFENHREASFGPNRDWTRAARVKDACSNHYSTETTHGDFKSACRSTCSFWTLSVVCCEFSWAVWVFNHRQNYDNDCSIHGGPKKSFQLIKSQNIFFEKAQPVPIKS